MRRSRRILILNKARREGTLMTHLTMKDGTRIFVRDWGQGQPIIFLHGWPLTADMWDNQMFTFGGVLAGPARSGRITPMSNRRMIWRRLSSSLN